MLPSHTDLEYFLELYKTQHVSRASERLGITQPSLSLSLKRLEEGLGVTLFIRSKAGMIPTKEADVLSQDVKRLISDWTQIGRRAKDSVNTVKGTVHLGCHPSVALYAIQPWIGEVLSSHQDLEISLVHDLSRKVLEKVVSHQIDMALVINPVKHPDLVIRPLLKDEVTLRQCKKGKVDTSTLIYDPSLIQAQSLLQKSKTKKNLLFKRSITSSSLELIKQLTEEGLGVGILPGKVAGERLKVFDSSIKPFKDELCLIYRADTPKTKAFEVVAERLKAAFKI